jgi:predicted ATPase/DNA-binding winged helix-turn-helix (wHTH) protein
MMQLHSDSVTFGNFRLYPSARILEREEVRIALGDRALDILIALVERAGELVEHKELMSRVWRGLVVEPGNLRVHMTSLRKTLGDGAGQDRYITNISGQGYMFIAPIARDHNPNPPSPAPEYPCEAARKRLVLPVPLKRMVGREQAVRTLCADIITDRFVTIVGPGGMGKTTVAISIAHALAEEFCGAVCFVDISGVTEPDLVASTIASTLGLTVQTDDVLPALLKCLESLRVLLVLDNCEHVIDAAAQLAERIFHEAPSVHILATSREALRAEGEHRFWLPPIASPPLDQRLSTDDALQFPAVKLFIERAAAGGARLDMNDANASLIAEICARLDGLALAIEITAGRVATHGLIATHELVKKRIGLHWRGRRTAPPRHQTLQALLDWSYDALTERERVVLRRLSVLIGGFTRQAATAIVAADDVGDAVDESLLDGLVAKSLLSVADSSDPQTHYRLLETTRSYFLEKLTDSSEAETVSRRHAAYLTKLLQNNFEAPPSAASPNAPLGNIRAALDWCFGATEDAHSTASSARDPQLAVALTSAAVPMFLQLSLLRECHTRTTSALELLDDATRGTPVEMVLQEARAISSTWASGTSESARSALESGIVIARKHGLTSHHLRLLAGMHIFLLRIGDLRGSAAVAEAFAGVARTTADPTPSMLADWLVGSAHHFMGHQGRALQHFRRSFSAQARTGMGVFGLDNHVRACVTYARVLWLSGFPDQAMATARRALSEAARIGNPLNNCFAYMYTAPTFIWCGDYATARELLAKLMGHPNWHALPSLHATAFAIQGELLVKQGEIARGVDLLRDAIKSMQTEKQLLFYDRAVCAFCEGLNSLGRHDEALTVICQALGRLDGDTESVDYPELLRVFASTLLSSPTPDAPLIEQLLQKAARIAQTESVPAWELRIAMTRLRARELQDSSADARQLVSHVYARFTEGLDSKDLLDARALLDELAEASPRKSA